MLMDEFFLRSKYFRLLLSQDLKRILELCVIGNKKALPAPAEFATLLREKTLSLLEVWRNKHGQHHKEIMLAYTYIKNTLKFKFPEVESRSGENQRSLLEAKQNAKRQSILKLKYIKLQSEIKEMMPDIESIITEISSCFQFLVPDVTSESSASTLFKDSDFDTNTTTTTTTTISDVKSYF